MRYPPPGKFSFEEWNDRLRTHSADFAEVHADATVVIYSSWETFTRVLNKPVAYGFIEGDQKKRGGSIWMDHLHPTSKMHDEVAKDIATLLQGMSPQGAEME